ncbi:hypothetical protein GCM10010279_38970 [Streptomyces mutabilis]|nr:hypothetical protein GCM10010279_38970 [Streptomyces mutabilis]
MAHCQSPSGAGESEVPLQRPQSSCWEAKDWGTPDGAAADGRALLVPPSSLSSLDEPPLQPAVSSAAAAVTAVHRTRRVIALPPRKPSDRAADGGHAMVGGVRRTWCTLWITL